MGVWCQTGARCEKEHPMRDVETTGATAPLTDETTGATAPVARYAGTAARLRRDGADQRAAAVLAASPVIDRAARAAATAHKLARGAWEDVAQDVRLDLLTTGAADVAPLTIGRMAGAAAARRERAARRETAAGDAVDVTGEERATAPEDDGARQRAAVVARGARIRSIGRVDVYAVSDHSRHAMRAAEDVYLHGREDGAIRAAMAHTFTPRRAADAAAWAAATAPEDGATVPATAPSTGVYGVTAGDATGAVVGRERVWVVRSPRAAEGCRVHGAMADVCAVEGCARRGPWRPAQDGAVWATYRPTTAPYVAPAPDAGDAMLGGYTGEVLATYRTAHAAPGDVLTPRSWRPSSVLPGATGATRAAMGRAAREWAGAVRAAGSAVWAADAAASRAVAWRTRATVTVPCGPCAGDGTGGAPWAPVCGYCGGTGAAAPVAQRATVGRPSSIFLGEWRTPEDDGAKERRRWATVRAGHGGTFAMVLAGAQSERPSMAGAVTPHGARWAETCATFAARWAAARAADAERRTARAVAGAVAHLLALAWAGDATTAPGAEAVARVRRMTA